MSKDCCHQKSEDLISLHQKQSKILWIVLWVNLSMFFIEAYFSMVSNSLALAGDSLDMLGDALAYGSSIYVVHSSIQAKTKVAVFKAILMLVSGVAVLGQSIYRITNQVTPDFEWMSGIGILALAANIFCLFLLSRHKADDINFKSVWICSRNDIISNLSVIAAAVIVMLTGSPWPDLIVGFGITILFVRSAFQIILDSRSTLKDI